MKQRTDAADCDVLVVGGGPVGLLTAYLCADAGIDVVVCERSAVLPRDLRATSFHPPTLDMLEPSGITGEIMRRGVICPDWQIRVHPAGERAVFDISVIKDETRHPFRLQCEQWKLAEALLGRLRNMSAATVMLGSEVVGIRDDSDGVVVKVEQALGTEQLRAGIVVGADGWQSGVRQWLGLPFEGETFPETTLVVTTPFRFEDHLEGLSMVTSCWTAESHVALLRLPEMWRLALYPDEERPIDEQASVDAVEAVLEELVPTGGRHGVTGVWPYRVNQRCVPAYRVGHVALAGDAAHVNSPAGGLGLNAGIHDAFALAGYIARILKGGEPVDLLDEYDRRRRPLAQEILKQAGGNRARMRQRSMEDRLSSLRKLQEIAADRERLKQFVLKASMIEDLRRAGQAY